MSTPGSSRRLPLRTPAPSERPARAEGPAGAQPSAVGQGPGTTRRAAPASGSTVAGSTVAPAVRIASDWTWRLLVIAVGFYGLVKLLEHFGELLVPILVALLLTALLHPLVERLARGMPRSLASLLALFGTLLLIVGLFALVGQQAVSGFADLRRQAIGGLGDVQRYLSDGPLHLSSSALQDYVDKAEKTATTKQSTIVAGAVGVASTATRLAEGFFIAMFSTFFFLSSGHRIWAWLLRMLPGGAQQPLDEAGRSGWVTLTHYVRATLIVAVVDGVGVGVGAALLGVPLAIPLGVVVFLGAFVPVVGALVTGVLAILVALVSHGAFIALAMLGVVLLVNQVEAHGLQPFLLGRAVSVHPLAVILAIAAGAGIAGIVGALFAVPVAAVANTMITSVAQRGRPVADPGEQIDDDDAPLSPDRPEPTDVDKTADTQHGAVTGFTTGR